MLALLASEPTLTRQRVWIQDKLWSDRGPKQGANSLRQVLFQIRHLFDLKSEILTADRSSVALDPEHVHVLSQNDGEFLEGIDIRDLEFESWLTHMRAKNSGNITNPLSQMRHLPPSLTLNHAEFLADWHLNMPMTNLVTLGCTNCVLAIMCTKHCEKLLILSPFQKTGCITRPAP